MRAMDFTRAPPKHLLFRDVIAIGEDLADPNGQLLVVAHAVLFSRIRAMAGADLLLFRLVSRARSGMFERRDGVRVAVKLLEERASDEVRVGIVERLLV